MAGLTGIGTMKDLVLRIRTRATFGYAHECAPRRVDVIRSPDGTYYSEYSKVDEAGKRVTGKHDLNSVKVESILDQLSTASLPVSPKFDMVCDGTDGVVEIHNRWGNSKFSWFGAPPDEWELLAEIADRVESWSEIDED